MFLREHTNLDITLELLPSHLPTKLAFIDQDDKLGTIGGGIQWSEPLAGESTIMEYRLYFEDSSRHTVGLPVLSESAGTGVYGNYTRSIADIPVPDGAKYIRMYMWDGVSEVRTPAVIRVWDAPLSLPRNAYMEDTDPSANRVQGVIHWDGVKDESLFANYVIMNNDPYDPYIIAAIPTAGLTQYDYHLPFTMTTNPFGYYSGYKIGLQSDVGDVAPSFIPAFITDKPEVTAKVPLAAPSSSIPAPDSLSFTDMDLDANEIGGKVVWSSSRFDAIESNELYFMDESNEVVGSIAKVFIDSDLLDLSQSNEVLYWIPMHTPIPEGAVKIGIYSTQWTSRSLEAATIELVDVSTTNEITVVPSQIQLKLGGKISEFIKVYKIGTGGFLQDITSPAAGTAYATSNADVATVTSDGLVQAVAAGVSEITVTHSVYSATIPVLVERQALPSPESKGYVEFMISSAEGGTVKLDGLVEIRIPSGAFTS